MREPLTDDEYAVGFFIMLLTGVLAIIFWYIDFCFFAVVSGWISGLALGLIRGEHKET